MALQECTDPVILDTTGQEIVTKLNELKQVVQPVNPCTDIDISLPTSGWSGSSGAYTYTYSNAHITDGCSVKVDFLESSSSGGVMVLDSEKVTGGVRFTSAKVPSVAVPVRIHILNADATSTMATSADQVSTDAVSGTSNVQDALSSLSDQIVTLQPKMKTDSVSVTFDSTYGLAYSGVYAYSRKIISAWITTGSLGLFQNSSYEWCFVSEGLKGQTKTVSYYYFDV